MTSIENQVAVVTGAGRGIGRAIAIELGRMGAKVVIAARSRDQLEETGRYWNCTTSLSVSPPDVQLPQALAVQLSLMLSEAVANAVRHGEASNVDVAMTKANGHLIVNVRDNGKGFNSQPIQDPPQEQEPIVTSSLRERVCALGGSLTVSSYPTGAELAIRLPVP
jgi:signal transduction histidine kinase